MEPTPPLEHELNVLAGQGGERRAPCTTVCDQHRKISIKASRTVVKQLALTIYGCRMPVGLVNFGSGPLSGNIFQSSPLPGNVFVFRPLSFNRDVEYFPPSLPKPRQQRAKLGGAVAPQLPFFSRHLVVGLALAVVTRVR